MTYEEFINNILETRGRFECGEEYHERHHIVPKCMGGTNDEENLIDLYAREHFEAHRLLALENPDNGGLVYAWWSMSHMEGNNSQDRYELTVEEYEEARIAYSKNISGENNPLYGVCRFGEDNPFYGKCHSEETKKKISDSLKGEKNPLYGKHLSEETKEKISKARKGKCSGENSPWYGKHLSNEHKEKLRELNIGERNPMYGKHPSEETRKKMSEARKGEKNSFYGKRHTEETKMKISEANKGKIAGGKHPNAKKVSQYNLDGYLIKIWDCIQQASNELCINKVSISECCKGKQKTAGGFIWKYADETQQNN